MCSVFTFVQYISHRCEILDLNKENKKKKPLILLFQSHLLVRIAKENCAV